MKSYEFQLYLFNFTLYYIPYYQKAEDNGDGIRTGGHEHESSSLIRPVK
jgi:hypothetical protein